LELENKSHMIMIIVQLFIKVTLKNQVKYLIQLIKSLLLFKQKMKLIFKDLKLHYKACIQDKKQNLKLKKI